MRVHIKKIQQYSPNALLPLFFLLQSPPTLPTDPLFVVGSDTRRHMQERVGIVGRTGAGKSSIIQALFRLTPPSGGIIEIDGINIGSVPLYRCRRRISIIPQDPVIFTGSVRSNLDPSGRLSDERLWQALDQVRYRSPIP